MSAPGPVPWEAFAAVLAEQPFLVRRLLAEHVQSEGQRCKGCTTPGTGTPGGHWPCQVYELAALAEQIHHARTRHQQLRERRE